MKNAFLIFFGRYLDLVGLWRATGQCVAFACFLIGEGDNKAGTAADSVLDPDTPTVCGYDLLCDAQPKAKMFFVSVRCIRAVKPVEYGLFLFVRYAASRVSKTKFKYMPLICQGKEYFTTGGRIRQGIVR